MHALEWSDALSLDLPLMDDTHREFVDLLGVVSRATDDAVIAAWRTLVEHTQVHFDQEDRWMRETRFAAGNCHSQQHQQVLDVMREGLQRAEGGDIELLRLMAGELAQWFPQHAQSMDAGLAQHLQALQFDTQTETLPDPSRVRPASMSGCGSISCS